MNQDAGSPQVHVEREREGERKEKKEAMCHVLQPGKLTWNPKKEVLEDDFLFQLGDF